MSPKNNVIIKFVIILMVITLGGVFGTTTNLSYEFPFLNLPILIVLLIGPFIGLGVFISLFGLKNLCSPDFYGNILGTKNILNLILFLGYIFLSFSFGLIISIFINGFNSYKFFILSLSILFGYGCILSAYLITTVRRNNITKKPKDSYF